MRIMQNGFESVRRFERQLTDNGYLVMKFFLHIPEKEQAKRIGHLEHEKDTVLARQQK